MAIESTVASTYVPPQVVSKNAGPKSSEVKVEVLQKHNPKPVPEAPKIDINRQPIISSKELEAKIVELNDGIDI